MSFSATKTRQNSFSSASTPTGGRKSLFGRGGTGNPESPSMERARKYARGPFSMSGRSTQSIVGIRSDVNLVESYGCQLPVLVNEALTFSDKNQSVSVTCAKNGWAWVVHGRRLLVWQYRDTRHAEAEFGCSARAKDYLRTPQRRGAMAQCRELTLPQCDIGHKASLISVFLSEGQQMASCLAVSPTGDVRYWPSIAHDGTSVDVTGILDGQEFDQLREVPSQEGYVLVTTTCSIVFLQLQLVNGRHVVQHRVLRQSAGFLGGIGKKFASIITGSYALNDRESKFVNVQCYALGEDRSAMIAIVSDRWLQLWRINNGGSTEYLLLEDSEVIRRIHENFHQKYWSIRTDRDDVELHLLDMQLHDNKLFVLASAISKVYAPQMHYALVKLKVSSNHDNVQLQDFIALKFAEFYSTATQQDCLKYRLIISRHHFYIYKDNIIYPLVLSNDATVVANDIESEKIEFHTTNDRIMCAAVSGEIPLFFSRTNGLVSVSPADFDGTEYLGTPFMSAAELQQDIMPQQRLEQGLIADTFSASDVNLHLYELDPDAMYGQFKDEVSLLKAAFVYRLKHNNNKCNTILNDLLQNICEAQAELTGEGTQLDKIVIKIAEDLANDIPAADPRWEDQWDEVNGKHSLGSSSSLQILTQLKEKSVALRHFVEFLHTTGIWEKLMAVPAGGSGVLKPTCYMLSDIHEKITAAIALRSMQSKYSKITEEALTRVVAMWGETPSGNLTVQDIFYVNLCKFEDIFTGFVDILKHNIETQRQSNVTALFIHDANNIVLNMLAEVSKFREKNSVIYTLSAEKLETYEYMPWTAMSGKQGIRDEITQFIDITVENGARPTGELELKQKLYQQVLKLIDFVLDGRKNCLESIRDTEKYTLFLQQFEFQRRDLISLLIDDEQYELAAQLAEKYLDFQSLIVICDATKNQDRLNSYIEKFAEFNFSQFAINWHLQQNRQGEVFERFKGNQAALAQFMRDHPSLGWIQLIFNGDYERASQVLLELAQAETESVQRKKTMLSLSKLAAHAATADLSSCMDKINSELNIIAYQQKLSPSLLTNFGYDVENPKVLSVEEIVNLYIAEENQTANEYDFGEALELLKFVEEPYDMRHKIWCAAILRDNWVAYDMSNAVDYLQSLLFFKLIEVSLMCGDLDDFLPNMDEFLNSSELGSLPQQQAFKYLLKLTYEYVNDAFRKNEESEQNSMET